MKKYVTLVVILFVSALIMQGFQCTSPTMESAKVAYSKNDYPTALKFLNDEINKNPANGEAYRYRAQIYFNQGNLIKAADDVVIAQTKKLTPESQDVVNKLSYALWTNSYNRGLAKISNYYGSNDQIHLDSAIMYFDLGAKLRPEIPDFSFYKGTVLEIKGDTSGALAAYKKYADEMKDEVQFAAQNSVNIEMSRDDLVNKFSKPVNEKTFATDQGTKKTTLLYKIDNKDVYFFTENTKENPDLKVIGWRIGAPATWSETEKYQYFRINVTPYKSMAQINYNRGAKEAAIENLRNVITLNPMDQDASASIVQIYQDLNKMDIAVKELEALIQKNPTNKFYWSQYGDIMMNSEKFDEAIQKYQKALEIDTEFDFVIRNIASAYKNRASIEQKRQNEAMSKDKTLKPDLEKYAPDLRKSAEYFEKSLRTKSFKDDYVVLSELGNIYTVLQDSKLNDIIAKLEALEPSIPSENKQDYYLKLLTIYGANRMDDKYEALNKRMK